ncbi:flagellar biosynthesis pathway, component FliQ [Terriglobus roseus DSM 18391]|uniref:Flagellar biosynthesis pathway, component FliQ n=2 Tax=Terriglobus roseus TaxID=392734 RepID=I3ZFW3_TERRK|nr:flagellar biosynthesis pathway, component FliQ [Terriglobus roseus DSM 18391]
MGPDMVTDLMRRLMLEALLLSAPLLIVGCLISIALTLVQTLTGIQEQTITAVPRLLFVFFAGLVSMPWFLRRVVTYTLHLWTDFHRFLG